MSRSAMKKMIRETKYYDEVGKFAKLSNGSITEQSQKREYDNNPDWQSNRQDIDLKDWRSAQQIYLPELGMKLGPAVNKMKKLWRLYKAAKRYGGSYRPKHFGEGSCYDYAYEIARIQYTIDLVNKTEFEELADLDFNLEFPRQEAHEEDIDTSGLSKDELAARREELAEAKEEVEDFYPDVWPNLS